MELFLWLYFYDNRWFFNFKVTVKIYKYIWILPLMFHSMLISVGAYYLDFSNNTQCVGNMKIWMYHRILFSFLICLNTVFFMVKITQAYERENSYFEKARKALPILSDNIHEYDYWIRRNSLFSTSGVLLLIQGLISFFWSYMTAGLYKNESYQSCELRLHQVINIHSNFICYSNVLLLVIFTLMLCIKIFFYVTGILHPLILVKISSFLYLKRSKLRTYFNQACPKDFDASKKLEMAT